MTWDTAVSVGAIVGRVEEQGRLLRAVRGAAGGEPCAVVVHGEAGGGKTWLVREVVRRATQELGATVRWGTCVRFGASTLEFAPLLSALRSELPDVPAPGLSPGPAGDSDPPEPVRLLSAIDAAVNAQAERGLTVLVVDDLQWADVSSLDTLSYLIAGFRDQQLVILATCRDEERPVGHPLHGWLADLRRMPGFSELSLPRLDLDETAALLTALHGVTPDLELAARVRERSGGNAYLTRLLGAEIAPGAHDVPRAAPRRLQDALIASWHRLEPVGREVTRLLAAGGRPVSLTVLTSVGDACGTDPTSVRPALEAAETQGIVQRQDDGSFWFRHPMLADVLYDAVKDDERTHLHRVFAEMLEAVSPRVAADLAVHHERARHPTAAYTWSLAAADSAAARHGSAEEAAHLVRACRLWPAAAEETRGPLQDRVDLLVRASTVCRRVIRYDDAQALLEEARALVDERADPLQSSRLLIKWCDVTWSRSGPRTSVVKENHDALRLTDDFPDSAERAVALSTLADSESWDHDRLSALRHVDEAVRVARRSGSQTALGSTLCSWAGVHLEVDGPTAATVDAVDHALRLARANDDVDELLGATIWRLNVLMWQGRAEEAARTGAAAFAEARELGEGHWSYFVASFAAVAMLDLGRPAEAQGLLREALAARCVGPPGALTRLTAALFDVYRGDLDGANRHFERALEVVDPGFGGLGVFITEMGTVVRLEQGDPHGALAWLRERLVVDGEVARERLPVEDVRLVARVLADLAERAGDSQDPDAADRARREAAWWEDELQRARRHLQRATFTSAALDLAWIEADLSRCHRSPDEVQRWEAVVRQCRDAGTLWDEGKALRRLGEAAVRGGAPRSELTATVRALHSLADDIDSGPLRAHAERLARLARVDLAEVVTVPEQRCARTGPMAALTSREREILGHLVAGRTYAEIADALTISEKTVSSHVSHILRKTSTSSRAEAAAWAMRLG